MRVLVGIDESEGSFHALQWTIDNLVGGGLNINAPPSAVTTDGGGGTRLLTLVHVHQPLKHYDVAPSAFTAAVPGVTAYPALTADSVRKYQEQISAGVLSRALQICNGKIKAETLILEGDPKDKICEICEQMHVDLLVVGSRGLGMIQRAFLGSVSDYCAHYAKCATLIVKPPRMPPTARNCKSHVFGFPYIHKH